MVNAKISQNTSHVSVPLRCYELFLKNYVEHDPTGILKPTIIKNLMFKVS